MKTIYMIHGWGDSSKSHWFPRLKEILEDDGFKVITFDMPDTEHPTIDNWVGKLKEITDINKEVYFIGHSIGCQTILRYLESLPANQQIGGVLSVAGWLVIGGLEPEELVAAQPWIDTLINFEKVKKHTNNFLAIFSNSDPYAIKENEELFKNNLDAKIFQIGDRGHITEPEDAEFIKGVFEQMIRF